MSATPNYLYVSERLATAVLERAGRVVPSSVLALAKDASALASPDTGTLVAPQEFVLAQLTLKAWILPKKGDLPRIAWFAGNEGSTHVALTGSAGNFVDRLPDDAHSAWWPSSAMGMERVVRAYAGRPRAAGVFFDLDGEDARNAAEWAMYISVGIPKDDARELASVHVLLRRYADVEDVVSAPPFAPREHVARVVVGAPLAVWSA